MDEVVIEAGRGFKNYWTDLWRYRELLYFLAWRHILVRYKQTIIGIAWALIRPFLTMVVFTIVFNKIAKFESPGSIPYPLLVFAAMLPWQFFSTALSESSNSLIGNANLISKVYFPRLYHSGWLCDYELCGFSHNPRAHGCNDGVVRFSTGLASDYFTTVYCAGFWMCLGYGCRCARSM